MIPARLAATRLPNKPLIEIAGRPMIQHVWERASSAAGVGLVAIATPDEAIADAARAFGAQVVMTSPLHRSGTDRLAEAADVLELPPDALVVNVQGDEPLLAPASIEAAIAPLIADPALPMSSLMCPCPPQDWDNPACVKVVCALNGDALYFSRARLPFPRNAEFRVQSAECKVQNPSLITHHSSFPMQHIGLYAYRRAFLATFAGLVPSPLEQIEGLEQLRVLENGFRIRMVAVADAPIGVDTPDDLARVRALLENK